MTRMEKCDYKYRFSSPFLPHFDLKKRWKMVCLFIFKLTGKQVWFPVWRLADWHAKVPHFFPVKREKRAYFRVSNRQGGGWVPGLEAFRRSPILPREKGFSPFFPHKREIGNLWKKCYKVPNLSVECLKTRDFEAQSECPNTATSSTIFEVQSRSGQASCKSERFFSCLRDACSGALLLRSEVFGSIWRNCIDLIYSIVRMSIRGNNRNSSFARCRLKNQVPDFLWFLRDCRKPVFFYKSLFSLLILFCDML